MKSRRLAMRFLSATLLAIFILISGGCSTVRVSQDYMPDTNFKQYRSYLWQKPAPAGVEDVRAQNPLLHERFHLAIDAALAARGYFQGAPEFLVTYQYQIQTRIAVDPYEPTFGFGYGRYYRYGGVAFGGAGSIQQYDVGILVIDFYDARTGTLIWRGTGSEILSSNPTPEKTTEFVNRLVNSILAQFPPY